MNNRVIEPGLMKTGGGPEAGATTAAVARTLGHTGNTGLAAAVVAMLAILLIEPLTPLGLAHGLLYTPVLIGYFLLSFHIRKTWLLAGVGVAFILIGWVISAPPVGGLPLFVATFNRLLSILCLGAGGLLCHRIGELMQKARADQAALVELNRSLYTKEQLLAIAADANKFGGFCIRLPERELLISDQALAIFGLPARHPAGLEDVIDHYLPQYRERVQSAFRRCLKEQQPYKTDAEIMAAGGHRRWIRIIASPWLGPDGKVIGIQGSLQDITEQKQLQDSVQANQDRFRTVADSLPLIVWTANAQGEVNFVNRATWKYSELEFYPDQIRDKVEVFIHPEDLATLLREWHARATEGDEFQVELRLLDRNGIYQWHYLHAMPIRDEQDNISEWCGVATNINDLKETKREYRRLAELLEDTFESITDILFSVDRDWKLSYMNTRAAQAFGHSRRALLGQSLWELCPELVGSVAQDMVRQAAETKASRQIEFYFENLDKWLNCLAYPMGEGLVLYCQDISKQQQMEAQLRKAQRMESVGLLSGGIAHDFNNLLTVILGNVESVRESIKDREGLARQLSLAEHAARNGAELIRQLLAFACRQPLRSEATAVNELIREIEPLVRGSVSEAVELRLFLAGDLWYAHVDHFQLENALINLCVNAVQAMPNGGRLLIETANERILEPKTRSVVGIEPGDYVRVSVSDDGQGIQKEHLDKIFDPFFTTKDMGTGLGLSTIYGFIKQSGGDISVYSEPGRGTTFSVYLPRTETRPEPGPEQPVRDSRGGTERLLLVEDDERVRDYACSVLTEAGYRVTGTASAREAIELLKQQQDFTLLFTDVVMPGGIHGPELAELACQVNSNLKVLFTSGYTANAGGYLDRGVNENRFLKKPYQKDRLLSAVRTAIDS